MNNTRPIYLDNNATTAIAPEVADAMAECYAAGYLNPASQHSEGRRARNMLEQARDGIGTILGAQLQRTPTDRIVFTSGGTEANNLAISGLRSKQWNPENLNGQTPQVVVSAVEHPSVLAAAGALRGCETKTVPVDNQGVVKLDAFSESGDLLLSVTRCVSVMLGNNETGAIQPVRKIVEICNSHNIPIHTDAVQAVGKIPVSFSELGVAAMTATAHKFHGPRGIGVLILRHDAVLDPIMRGGSQQLGSRPGTESVALAVGMWKALELCQANIDIRSAQLQKLRDEMQSSLTAELSGLVVNSFSTNRLPHTLNVSLPGLDRQALLLALDHAGLACSTGSACESGSSQPSHVLIAMNASKEVVEGSIRISLSAQTTADEIDQATKILVQTVRRLEG